MILDIHPYEILKLLKIDYAGIPMRVSLADPQPSWLDPLAQHTRIQITFVLDGERK